ncbi:MAG: hypothetical protein ACRDT8_06960, partial [Micromonosporaceae bacterium]
MPPRSRPSAAPTPGTSTPPSPQAAAPAGPPLTQTTIPPTAPIKRRQLFGLAGAAAAAPIAASPLDGMKPAASQPASRVRRPPFGDHPFALGVASGDPPSDSGLDSA